MSGFAENQLKKYGWTKGQGLGKNAEGRKTPIIITKKNDTRGLGDNSVDWSFEWWNKVYTKTLDNIKVSKTSEGEVKVSKVIKESIVPKNNMGIISTNESLYSLTDSSNSTDQTISTTFSSSDIESTHKNRFDDDKTENLSSNPKMKSLFYYGNFVKSSTGSLDLNGWNKPIKKMEINNESKSTDSTEKEKVSLCTNHLDMSQDEEKQDGKRKREKSKKKKRKCEENIILAKNEKYKKRKKKENERK
ncbi:hypothetical protein RhiirA5_377813 [Rhizophagus irregularis]|uniref:G-patch domain-containing protein n=3 Tax=Rhizophagus irregularis TaxID=588596 RepID=A0A2I1ES50_9GLOM|nr:hypothetical protein GLOIN_2v1478019 [Rhizophagus irregularis DAOM 181602=DAOM 197198]EXX58702.1 hypothetical protein RirG_195490 [Rhizophagus irregularis DAOM 197198w]PKC06463.1 hypothetical protein RhiirA5_377813 [Rhizophagus irregularis]PKC69928.1 hypothetical protein RhiirA1_455438 [Rhizophagus irregularis]PKY24958.1 hypothetical protein RhiirB3_388391 [Rhizophagus irregularis]POG72044.1 hypothetical protein GLOIN_2v1478019 [Rhizophagus irregularis DAOM 181602=DAOM 197198]|eukprot:XP_025178910.1 hypothetical protein GLOIN_2v1478019 [Rhizophagus irregularis DAOM 181602=DAOM 197198]